MRNPEARKARARLAAHRRWHPGDDLEALTEQCMREIEISRTDEAIDNLVARAPKMTDEQASLLAALLSHPCRADDCMVRVGFYEDFCYRHRILGATS